MDKNSKMMIFCLFLAAISSPVFTAEWKAYVVKELDALVSSCIVVPCKFTHPEGNLPTSRIRGIWHLSDKRDQRIYYEDPTQVLENFRGRTKLLGHLGQSNCSLEIVKIKDHDNGPFCFRIELTKKPEADAADNNFSFEEDCISFKMLPDPPKPALTHTKTAIQGQPYTVTCSVTHTCPSHMPQLTWKRETADEETTDVINGAHKEVRFGYWEAQSVLTVIPEEKDDHGEITCTAEFHGGSTSSASMTLYIKRKVNYNHIIIPIVVVIVTTGIFAGLCFLMMKRYKERIAELQSQDGSMWNRLSRMSRRIRSDGPPQSRSNQRQSIWSRFSRRPKGETVDLAHMPKTVNSKCVEPKVSKARVPSPKSQPKSCNFQEDSDDGDEYVNTADLNIYGNI